MKISSTSHQATLEDTILALQSQIKDLKFNLALSHRENDKLKSELVQLKNGNKSFDWSTLGMPLDFKIPDLRGYFLKEDQSYVKSTQSELSKKYVEELDISYSPSLQIKAANIQGTNWDAYRGEWNEFIRQKLIHDITDPGHSHGACCGSSNMKDSASVTGAPVIKTEDGAQMTSDYFKSMFPNIY